MSLEEENSEIFTEEELLSSDYEESEDEDTIDKLDDYYLDNFYTRKLDNDSKLAIINKLIDNSINNNNNLTNNKYLDFFRMIIIETYKYDMYVFEQLVSKNKIKNIEAIYNEEIEDYETNIRTNLDFIYSNHKSLSICCKDIPSLSFTSDSVYLDLKIESEKDLFISSIKSLKVNKDYDLIYKLLYALRNEIKNEANKYYLEHHIEDDSEDSYS